MPSVPRIKPCPALTENVEQGASMPQGIASGVEKIETKSSDCSLEIVCYMPWCHPPRPIVSPPTGDKDSKDQAQPLVLVEDHCIVVPSSLALHQKIHGMKVDHPHVMPHGRRAQWGHLLSKQECNTHPFSQIAAGLRRQIDSYYDFSREAGQAHHCREAYPWKDHSLPSWPFQTWSRARAARCRHRPAGVAGARKNLRAATIFKPSDTRALLQKSSSKQTITA